MLPEEAIVMPGPRRAEKGINPFKNINELKIRPILKNLNAINQHYAI